MPSQDLLFPILPRAPATPSPDDIKRELTQISRKQRLRKIGADSDGSPSRQRPSPPARRDQRVVMNDDQEQDPEHRIDLFV